MLKIGECLLYDNYVTIYKTITPHFFIQLQSLMSSPCIAEVLLNSNTQKLHLLQNI